MLTNSNSKVQCNFYNVMFICFFSFTNVNVRLTQLRLIRGDFVQKINHPVVVIFLLKYQITDYLNGFFDLVRSLVCRACVQCNLCP